MLNKIFIKYVFGFVFFLYFPNWPILQIKKLVSMIWNFKYENKNRFFQIQPKIKLADVSTKLFD